ncbi:MAG: class II aldolase/adducin family protein [Armatimonadetes bacterium]|nr:class II aldolase/adducin family protein [Armatimonadota bacterium]
MSEIELRALMCDMGRRLWQRNLVGATEGNLSLRLSPQRILCTPSGVSKGHLRPTDLVVIDNHGVPHGAGVPSSEIKLHLKVYADRKDCHAVVHAHPLTATAFALAGESIPDDLLPEAIIVLGSVANVPFAMPGTLDVAYSIEPFLPHHRTFLLANHGAFTLGKTLEDAFFRMETLERVAQLVLTARQLGSPQPIPARAFRELSEKYLNGEL